MNELLILHALAGGEPRLEVAAAAALIQLPAAAALETLERLAAAEVLGSTKAEPGRRTYHLTPAAAARLGRAPALLAAQEPGGGDDQAARILAHVRAQGRIKRDETAALCAVTPRQASYLLDKLVQAGQLVRTGERRGVEYHLP